tara:strand:+ start:45 stop:230 length:186 start_codon:yes stop_codon:yes gene_type:complete
MEGQGLSAEGQTYFRQFIIDGIALQVLTPDNDRQKAYDELIAPRLKELKEEVKQIKKVKGL